MPSPDLSIIIPAYQEAENLKTILPRINKTLEGMSLQYEINVVDALKPMDETKDICRDNHAFYINRQQGNDYGDAVRTGLKYAKGRYIVFMDADGSHSPEFLSNLYNSRQNYDVVIASRYIEGGNTENDKLLILMSKAVNIVYSKFLHLECLDVSNSFKLYDAAALKQMHLVCKNFDIIEEILVKLRKMNKHLKIKEIPYVFKKRMFGQTKRNLILFSFSYVFTLIKLKFMK